MTKQRPSLGILSEAVLQAASFGRDNSGSEAVQRPSSERSIGKPQSSQSAVYRVSRRTIEFSMGRCTPKKQRKRIAR